MFQVPEKSHLFHLFYVPTIVRFTFITVHNISVYGIMERKYFGTLVGWRSRFFSFHNIYRAFCDSGTWTR